MNKLDETAQQDDARITEAIGVLSNEGRPCEAPEAMHARTGIPQDRVRRSYLRLYYSGLDVPFPPPTEARLREVLAEAARALRPLAAAHTLDDSDPTKARDEWTGASVLNAEVWDARDALTRIESLLYPAGSERPGKCPVPAITADCEVPPPLGFARRVQVPKALLIDAIQEAALALEGDSNDREHDALAILREELQSWADDDFDIAEVVRITASRKIGDAVISAAGNPKGTALLQLVNSVAQSGQPLVPDAEAGNRV